MLRGCICLTCGDVRDFSATKKSSILLSWGSFMIPPNIVFLTLWGEWMGKERREGKWKNGEDDNNSKVPAVVGISFLCNFYIMVGKFS